MQMRHQQGIPVITILNLSTGRAERRRIALPTHALHDRITAILRRGVGEVPCSKGIIVSVSFGTSSAQVLFGRGAEQLLLMGIAWGFTDSEALWQWLLTYREIMSQPIRTNRAVAPCQKLQPLPWRASVGLPIITPAESARLERFAPTLAVTLIDWVITQN
jgi:hypothetical protein